MKNINKFAHSLYPLWFFVKILIFVAVIIFILSVILKAIGVLNIISSVALGILAIILYVGCCIFSVVWEQEKAIKKDDEEFIRNQN